MSLDGGQPLLVARHVTRAFGGVTAVDVDEFTVAAGRSVALIGPNGAGKTTFFDILTGFQRADTGWWSLDGRPIAAMSPDRIARAGMVRTFQRPKLLPSATVLENVALGAARHPGERLLVGPIAAVWRRNERRVIGRAREVLEQVGLSAHAGEYAGTLSGGQRKLLQLARALMSEPRLLMLDEPMAGVSPVLAGRVVDQLNRLREEAMTIVFIEHDLGVVARLSDEVVCMAHGQVIARGAPATVAGDPAVIDAYLGSSAGRPVE